MKSSYIFFVHGWQWEKVILTVLNDLLKESNIVNDICPTPSGNNTFEFLKKELEPLFPQSEFVIYNYPTSLISVPNPENKNLDFIPNANNLLDKIQLIKKYYIEACEDSNSKLKKDDLKIVLIGHSAGGIVIRQALILAEKGDIEIDENAKNLVNHIILIASPSEGTPVLKEWLLRSVVFPKTSTLSKQIRNLCCESSFINKLNSDWEIFKKSRSNFEARCIYASSDPFAPAPPKGKCIIDNEAITIPNTDHNNILNNFKCRDEIKTILYSYGFK